MIKVYISRVFLMTVGCLFLSGCATLVNGPSQKIAFSMTPCDATVSGGKFSERTPGTIELKRNRDHFIMVSKPGYKTQYVSFTRVMNETVYGNIVSFGLTGTVIDAISGANFRLIPEEVSIVLRPLPFHANNSGIGCPFYMKTSKKS